MSTLQETLAKNIAQLSAVIQLGAQDLPGRTKQASDKLRELANDLDKAAESGDVGAFRRPQQTLASLQESWVIQGLTDELVRIEEATKNLAIYKNLQKLHAEDKN